MNELVRALAAKAAATMGDVELATLGRGLPDAELATMVRQAMQVKEQPQSSLAERAAVKEPVPNVPGRHDKTPVQDAILQVLRDHPGGLTFTAARNACKAPKGSVYAALNVHLRAGRVEKVGKGQGATWKLA